MEKSVTLRFYDVDRTRSDRPTFGELLERIGSLPMAAREKHVGLEDMLVRLEDFTREGADVAGQLIRGQTGNRPGRMLADRTDTLPFVEPLGHGIAFRYQTTTGLLAIQYDPRVLAPSRMVEYLIEHDSTVEYILRPRMRDDAWERFEAMPVRKLEVTVAGHPNVADLDNRDNSVWHNVASMKQRYGADTVSFKLSMGHRGGALSNAVKTVAREAFARHKRDQDDIRVIRGVMDTGDGVPNEEVDLMGELFDVKEKLDFPENDFARFYELRRLLLKSRMQRL